MEFLLLTAILGAGLYVFFLYWKNQKRHERLMAKYGDADTVKRIMASEIWQGMTRDQLLDSVGKPVDVGTKTYKAKTTEVYKYQQTGKNRFGSKITIENGAVVGWDKK